MMRLLAIVLTSLLLILQHRLWLSEEGWPGLRALQQQVAAAHARNELLVARNLQRLEQIQARSTALASVFPEPRPGALPP